MVQQKLGSTCWSAEGVLGLLYFFFKLVGQTPSDPWMQLWQVKVMGPEILQGLKMWDDPGGDGASILEGPEIKISKSGLSHYTHLFSPWKLWFFSVPP